MFVDIEFNEASMAVKVCWNLIAKKYLRMIIFIIHMLKYLLAKKGEEGVVYS